MGNLLQLLHRFKRKQVSTFKPVILVTGCSSGNGLALAKLLHEQTQYRIVVTTRPESVARLRERFEESDRFWVRALDVTSENQRVDLLREIEETWKGVDILINNAGISYQAVLEHMTEEAEQQQMATNYFGPLSLMRLVIPHMRRTGRGKIINISSVSGIFAIPTMSSFGASKLALESATEALWYEMKPFGISVSLVQPGFIRSRSLEKVYSTERSSAAARTWQVYSDFYLSLSPLLARLMEMSLTTPDALARRVLKVIQTENPPPWVSASFDAFVLQLARRFVPRRLLLPLLFRLMPESDRWASQDSQSRARKSQLKHSPSAIT